MFERSVLSAILLLAACADGDKPVVEPFADGKADVASRVEDQGELALATPRAGMFTEDLEFHGFHLTVAAGAVVTIENTHLGTAAQLDSTLFVYGPRTEDGFGGSAIAFDDDSGWGRHARLTELRLEDGGEYLVVLGTADGRGRGQYRIEARCENGACVPSAPACDAALSAGIQSCIATMIADGDLEGDHTTSYDEALAICTDGEALGGIFDEACASPGAPSYCALSFEAFFNLHVPPCAADLGARTGLCGTYLDQALSQTVEGMWFTSESDYPYAVVSWPDQSAVTAAAVLALSGLEPSSTVETGTFEDAFSWSGRPEEAEMDDFERASVRRHRHLRRVLEGNLADPLLVRIGSIEIQVFFVGRTACGELAGVTSTSIET